MLQSHSFTLREILISLLQSHSITSGRWTIISDFEIVGMTTGETPDTLLPSVIVKLKGVSIKQEEKSGEFPPCLTIDAEEIGGKKVAKFSPIMVGNFKI